MFYSALETFVAKLKHQLQKPLPGQAIQARMSPQFNGDKRFTCPPKPGVRNGSVLILLYPEQGNLYIPLMQRPVYNGHHSGQISFPGGKEEPEDPDPVFTALREAHEEMGIDPTKVEVLGTLTQLYIPPSNYMVLPVVGWTTHRPAFVPDPFEVAEIIEVALSDLLNEGNIRTARRLLASGFPFHTPCYFVEEQEVWGATAMMLSEFTEVVRKAHLVS